MRTLTLITLALFIISCGSDDSGPTAPSGPTAVSGRVFKGAVDAASVRILAVNSDRTPGAVVAGPFTTDADGNWSGQIPAAKAGPYFIRATGGTYTDEATSVSVDIGGGTLLGFSASGSGTVSPFTQMLCDVVSAADPGLTATQAWQMAAAAFASQFGFDPTATDPSITGTVAQQSYVAALGGASLLVDQNPALTGISGATLFDLVVALIRDAADNSLDGDAIDGTDISVGTGVLPALDLTGLQLLVDACNQYADSVPELADLLFDPIDLDFGDILNPGGGGDGTLTLSGPGAQLLSFTTFEVFFASTSGDLFSWSALGPNLDAMALAIITSDFGGATVFSTALSFASEGGVDHSWSSVLAPGSSGLTRNGDQFNFVNVILQGQDGEGNLILNGNLVAAPDVGP